jgi:membrane protein DedA with SNARE-associated domain
MSIWQHINQYGVWTYAILFPDYFMETGFVVTPFLPGDSLYSQRVHLRRWVL